MRSSVDVHQAVQYVLDQIDLVGDPVLRAELLLTLRDTSDRGFKRGRRKVAYELKADGWRLSEIESVVRKDPSWVSRDIAQHAQENGLTIPKRVGTPESVWRPNLERGHNRLRSSGESTPTTS